MRKPSCEVRRIEVYSTKICANLLGTAQWIIDHCRGAVEPLYFAQLNRRSKYDCVQVVGSTAGCCTVSLFGSVQRAMHVTPPTS